MNKQDLIHILITLSKVDNFFDEFEFTYILKLATQLGIHDEKIKDLIQKPLPDHLVFPKSERERMEVLYYLLFLMKVDQVISEEEKEMIQHYGFKLGFNRPMIDEFISIMERNKFKKVSTEEMLSVIKKYLN